MSNNLTLTQLAANQASPEVPVNDAAGQVDAALTELLDFDLTGGDGNVTTLQFQRNVFFRAINATAAPRNITLPANRRGLILFESDVGNTKTVTLVRGTATVVMQPGRLYAVRLDGTSNGLFGRDIGGVNEPNDFHVFLRGVMVNSQLCLRQKATRAFTLPQNLTFSLASATANATASTTITLKKNGSSIGTIVFALGASTGTFTFSAAVSFAVGDVFTIEGPATADATLADVTLDLFGTR